MDTYGICVDGETFGRKAAVGDDKTTTVDEGGRDVWTNLKERTTRAYGD